MGSGEEGQIISRSKIDSMGRGVVIERIPIRILVSMLFISIRVYLYIYTDHLEKRAGQAGWKGACS